MFSEYAYAQCVYRETELLLTDLFKEDKIGFALFNQRLTGQQTATCCALCVRVLYTYRAVVLMRCVAWVENR